MDKAIRDADIRYEKKWRAVRGERDSYLRALGEYEALVEELKGLWNPVVFADTIEYRLKDAE